MPKMGEQSSQNLPKNLPNRGLEGVWGVLEAMPKMAVKSIKNFLRKLPDRRFEGVSGVMEASWVPAGNRLGRRGLGETPGGPRRSPVPEKVANMLPSWLSKSNTNRIKIDEKINRQIHACKESILGRI